MNGSGSEQSTGEVALMNFEKPEYPICVQLRYSEWFLAGNVAVDETGMLPSACSGRFRTGVC
jgi:hypothetical protein